MVSALGDNRRCRWWVHESGRVSNRNKSRESTVSSIV